MDLKSTYNKIAEDWTKDHNDDTWWQEGTNHFLSFLPKGAVILDVGCGAGIKTRYIADRGYAVSGIDFSEKMIEIAGRENPDLEFNVLDVYELEKLNKKYDAVFAQAVLLHIPKARVVEVLNKMKDLLNPEGLLYIAVKGIKDDGVEEKIITENDYGYEYDRFFSYFSPIELRGYFEKLNMQIVWDSEKDRSPTNWFQLIARK